MQCCKILVKFALLRKHASSSGFMGALRGQRLCSCRAPSSLNPSILTISRLGRVTYPSLLHVRLCKVMGKFYHTTILQLCYNPKKSLSWAMMAGNGRDLSSVEQKGSISVNISSPLNILWLVARPCCHEKLNIQSMRRGREEHDWQARDHKCSTAQNGNRTL